MNIRFSSARPSGDHALALPVAKGGQPTDAAIAELSGRASRAARFEGDTATILELLAPAGRTENRILLVGMGDAAKANAATCERIGGALVARLQTSGETTLVIDLDGIDSPLGKAEIGARIALGARLRDWRYDRYRTKLSEKAKPTLKELVIVGAGAEGEELFAAYARVADGVALTRELVTEPANIIYPESFVERCQRLSELGVTIRVLDEREMATLGMGALLGVAQGSARPARLLVLDWNGTGDPDARPVVFVGKGVTFDTGGISIKPAAGMEDMKWDMGGAGAVAGALAALAGRKARARVVGVCGLVENMPSDRAQRPGDVVTSLSGQTVEVINTDAEGRLVLCDAITWAQREYKPEVLIDLATLTGAIIISLGNEYGGLFANDDELADQLLEAGKASGDGLWRFPLGEAYDQLIESPIADMKNVGPRGGGSITAAQFLKRFVDEGVKWAHLDIAGMVWAGKAGPTWDKGATGFGVRLLDRYIAANHEG